MHLYSQEMWHQHLAEAGFEQITDPVAKLEHGLRISIRYLSENRELYQFIFTESKYLDKEHLQKVLEMDDQNVVGFYRHLLSLIPGEQVRGREAELAANLVVVHLHVPGPAGVEPGSARCGRRWTRPSTSLSTSSSAVWASSAEQTQRRPRACW